jgi:dihydroneopterin aldolase
VVDRIVLGTIRARGRHGVSDEERARLQEFDVDLACSTDAARAAATDDLARTIDYRRLREIALSFAEGSSYRLLETLADRIASGILEELDPQWVRVRVTKLRPEGVGVPASVEVVRGELAPAARSAPVELHVGDFGPAKDFYGALGFKVLREDADGYLVLGNGIDMLRFWPGTPAALEGRSYFARYPDGTPPGHGLEVVLSLTDLDGAYERMQARGAVIDPMRRRHWGLRDFRAVDPYGFYVRCTEPHDPVSGARA